MLLFDKVVRYFRLLRNLERMNLALSRAAAAASLRRIDPADPLSWEFCGFSQNGEDGILDYLTRRIKNPNHYFVEIGASDFMENNTAWLAFARKFGGLMVEGHKASADWAEYLISFLELPLVQCASLFVTEKSAGEIIRLSAYPDPDVLSLDIDGMDYYVAKGLLEGGLRPRICVIEYNAAFGPQESLTIPYQEDFVWHRHGPGSRDYAGVSIAGWRKLFAQFGYRFLTVESSGCNAFFVDPAAFEAEFLNRLGGVQYLDSRHRLCQTREPWQKRLEKIKGFRLVPI